MTSADHKTVRGYVDAAVAAGVSRDGGEAQLTDELLGGVVEAVRPARPRGHGPAWEVCQAQRADLECWLQQGLTVVKVHDLLGRRGVGVPYRTVHRFCAAERGFRRATTTVRVADGPPRRRGADRLRPHGIHR